VAGLTPGAERVLASATWEGNVRELRNVIERACILVDGEFITERELGVSMPGPIEPSATSEPAIRLETERAPDTNRDLLVTVERDHIQRALLRAGGNKKAAAKMLGLSRRALYRRLERLDLSETITRRADGMVLAEA
jgi:DNA-binding NtrC family response regulator